MKGTNYQFKEPHRFHARKPSMLRCAGCNKIVDRRIKPLKGKRYCKPCETMVAMAEYFELRSERSA